MDGVNGSDQGIADPTISGMKAVTAAKNISSFAENLESFAAGGVGGVFSVLVGHPFDLLKVRLQTAAKGTYAGTLDCVRKTVAKDGPLGLYRGVWPPLVGVTPMFAVSFWAYDVSKRAVTFLDNHGPLRTATKDLPMSVDSLSIRQLSTAGFLSAIPTTFVAAPFERIKVLLQLDGQTPGKQKYSGPIDVIVKLFREGGIRSVFRGSLATFARDGPGSAAYFGSYEIVKKMLTPKNPDGTPGKLSIPAVILAGGTAGLSMWMLVFPIDTIKSHLQSAQTASRKGFLNTVSTIYRSGGVKAFFPGIGPALLRAYPANGELQANFAISIQSVISIYNIICNLNPPSQSGTLI